MYKFIQGEYELHIDRRVKRKLKKSPFQVISFGHTHKPRIWKLKEKWILNTGNWRDEYVLNEKEKKYQPKPKSFGFILHTETEIKQIKLPITNF